MALALAEARRARGWSSPNPPVGAVVVRDGAIVGRGHTQPPGQAHAEVMALRQAGPAARGADLYVTLEPCGHHGRTPPCTAAIIAAGIARVHVALRDPNPAVDGAGLAQLAAAGIDVTLGDGAAAAAELCEGFATHILTGRPLVIAKYAMSLDGRIATATGQSRWITGPTARAHLHRLRATVDAILAGAGTVLADDPLLTARVPAAETPVHQPLRVVLDSAGRLPLAARLFDPALPGRTLVATTDRMPADRRAALAARGVEVLTLPATPAGVALPELLDALGRRGVTSLLVEGGARVHAAFFAAGLVHKVLAYIAPVIIGGAAAPGPVAGAGAPALAAAPRLTRPALERLGPDLLLTAYVPATTRHLPHVAGHWATGGLENDGPAGWPAAAAAPAPEPLLAGLPCTPEVG
jgi:diaminohydroxyphosphoribosylaminopyrimidine deaminase/5-amino-6-(5-phosphoribosylamino)uracil reductase